MLQTRAGAEHAANNHGKHSGSLAKPLPENCADPGCQV